MTRIGVRSSIVFVVGLVLFSIPSYVDHTQAQSGTAPALAQQIADLETALKATQRQLQDLQNKVAAVQAPVASPCR